MAMTVRKLKGRIFLEIQDNNPGTLLPSAEAEIRRAISLVTRKIGGVRSSETFSTVVGQREYGSADGYPTDAIAVYGVFNESKSGVRITPISRADRSEDLSTGNPSSYYVYDRRKIGFDGIVSEVMTIRVDYLGLGTQIALPTDEILPTLPAVEDDGLYDCLVWEVAYAYFSRKALNDTTNYKFYEHQAEKFRIKASNARYRVISEVNNMNYDEGLEIVIDKDYFNLYRSGQDNLRRFGHSGDILRIS